MGIFKIQFEKNIGTTGKLLNSFAAKLKFNSVFPVPTYF